MTDVDSGKRLGLSGLRAAVARLVDDGSPQLSASEALFWTVVLDDQLRDLPWYKSKRSKDPDGALVLGLRFARNGVAHGAVLLGRDAGLVFPLFANGVVDFGPWIWQSSDELTEYWTPKRSSALGKPEHLAYVNDIAGRQVVPTLERVLRWFTRVELANWVGVSAPAREGT